jgi:hypothetical protein
MAASRSRCNAMACTVAASALHFLSPSRRSCVSVATASYFTVTSEEMRVLQLSRTAISLSHMLREQQANSLQITNSPSKTS